jgi:hypothetical protein
MRRRKVFYQWAAVGILSLIGWGVDVMPSNTSWIPSAILWGIAGIWFTATVVYLIRHRHDTSNDRKQGGTNTLEEVKSDLIALNEHERSAASIKAKTPCSNDTAIQIHDDFTEIFGVGIISLITTTLQEIVRKNSVDPLITFFKQFGDILDSNGYGLKAELENNDPYKSLRMGVAQRRLKLRIGKKRNRILQKNIDRVRSLSYGLNSSILFRSVLGSLPETKNKMLGESRVTLEGLESVAEQTLNTMLNDLDNEWEITKENKEAIECMLGVLSALSGIQEDE